VLVDTGPDIRAQLIGHKIPQVDAVIYTHSHADHIAGLDEIRILNRILGAKMPTYATAKTWDDLQRRFDYAFKPWNGGGFFRPVFEEHVIEAGQVVDIAEFPIQLIGQDHGFMQSLGLRLGDFAYCTDVVRLDAVALAALQGLETLVVDCFTRGTPHPTHANLAQVLEWVAVLKPRRTVLTHMGPSMDYGWLAANLPDGVEAGFDGMVITGAA
jgi:phosphoribosyl 1,2-cyclic phosphate phosphodiesterase